MFQIVLARGRRDGAHIADVLDHRSQRDRQDGDDSCHDQTPVGRLEDCESRVLHLERQAEPGSFLHAAEVTQTAAGGYDVRAQHAEQDRHDPDHTLAPDVAHDDDDDGQQGDPPVGAAVADGGTRKCQTDGDDDRARDHGREEAHDFLRAEGGEQAGQDEIHQTGTGDTDAGIGQRFGQREAPVGTHLRDGSVASEECEGRSEECGDLHFGQQVEDQGSQSGKKKGCRDRQPCNDRDEDSRSEHCEQVLQSEERHPGLTQLTGVVDSLVLGVGHSSRFFTKIRHARKKTMPLRGKLSTNYQQPAAGAATGW